MELEGGSVRFFGRGNGTCGIEVSFDDGYGMHLFPFESRDEAMAFLKEAPRMPGKLYELLKRNGVRS